MSYETDIEQTDIEQTDIEQPDAAIAPTGTFPRPRIRAGAIAWGLIVATIGGIVILVIGDADRRADFAEWIGGATPGGAAFVAVLAVGCFILLLSALALIRRAQHRLATRARPEIEHPPIG